jgi:hypothetical protein
MTIAEALGMPVQGFLLFHTQRRGVARFHGSPQDQALEVHAGLEKAFQQVARAGSKRESRTTVRNHQEM